MNDPELEVEQGATSTITAQLKARERGFLQERSDLRARITAPPSADDATVQQEILRVSGDIMDNEQEIARNNIIASLIAKLRLAKSPGGSASPVVTPSTPARVTSPGGGTTAPPPLPALTPQYRQILGKLPEYKLTDDFDVFLARFETYCSLNKITDGQHSKLLLDSALTEGAKLRASEISALYDPFKSETFSVYAQRLRNRFYPQAKSTLYKNAYDTIKQKPNQSVTDYCSSKYGSLGRRTWATRFSF